ncbi:hypothetical protein Poly24_03390 [Rosistilla carotiformis]|uniref:Uncharacterized protein n=1 Tax=Rosistilla carotiformis TaxID=2528017 RepID=A0A518JM91_9BACT|nr:hypothetical protein Poly24_03390 [Rosistilla carotiformis]
MNSILPPTNYRICLQLCLLVSSLWVGPTPIVHSHASAIDSRMGDVELVQHLQRHHRDGFNQNNGSDWHLHWLMRGVGYAGLNGEASVVQSLPCYSMSSNAPVDLSLGDLLAANPVDSFRGRSGTEVDRTLSSSNWFSGQALSRISMPTCSSVMRC